MRCSKFPVGKMLSEPCGYIHRWTGGKLQGGPSWSRTVELDPEERNLVVRVTGWERCVKPSMHCSCAGAMVKVGAIKMAARTKQAVSVVICVDRRNRQVPGGRKGLVLLAEISDLNTTVNILEQLSFQGLCFPRHQAERDLFLR